MRSCIWRCAKFFILRSLASIKSDSTFAGHLLRYRQQCVEYHYGESHLYLFVVPARPIPRVDNVYQDAYIDDGGELFRERIST